MNDDINDPFVFLEIAKNLEGWDTEDGHNLMANAPGIVEMHSKDIPYTLPILEGLEAILSLPDIPIEFAATVESTVSTVFQELFTPEIVFDPSLNEFAVHLIRFYDTVLSLDSSLILAHPMSIAVALKIFDLIPNPDIERLIECSFQFIKKVIKICLYIPQFQCDWLQYIKSVLGSAKNTYLSNQILCLFDEDRNTPNR